MAKFRQIVLIKVAPRGAAEKAEGAAPAPIAMGTKREVLRTLAKYNTAPDGSPDGLGVAHGPGLRVELPMVDDKDEVKQILVTVLEEEIGWPVLSRMCEQNSYRLMDPETGRTFGG